MRIATFNVENLFECPAIMNLDDWNPCMKVLAEYSRLNDLASKDSYSQADKDELVNIMPRRATRAWPNVECGSLSGCGA